MSNPRQANVILSTKINTVDEDAGPHPQLCLGPNC